MLHYPTTEKFPEFTIHQLLSEGCYVIPRYQRNYAWTEAELQPLIDDILWGARREHPYYLGTLVVHRRSNGDFEVIDGQQRLTTLSLMASWLSRPNGPAKSYRTNQINLIFESRTRSSRTLKWLHEHQVDLSTIPEDLTEEIETIFRLLIDDIIGKRCDELGVSVSDFSRRFYEYTRICRVEVPQGTDLNHYFEVMNNRGEQLEKHEVLKARLSNKLEEVHRTWFAVVWDACSVMSRYVQYGFPISLRKELFGRKWSDIPKWEPDALVDIFGNTPNLSTATLSQIIEVPDETKLLGGKKKDLEEVDHFQPIVDFPNFLLHVLGVFLFAEDDRGNFVTLDDQKLLKEFDEKLKSDRIAEFGCFLLKIRALFDRYVIKRGVNTLREEWQLEELVAKKKKFWNAYPRTTKFSEDDSSQLSHLILLQSMLHVSTPTQTYKYWLLWYLWFLNDRQVKGGTQLSVGNCIDDLLEVTHTFIYNRFIATVPLDYECMWYEGLQSVEVVLDESHLNYGNIRSNLLLNFIDYLYWKKDAKEVYPKYKDFSFSFRSSVEHFYPRNPVNGEGNVPFNVNSIGNLCLISRGENSKLSNYLPQAKLEQYLINRKMNGVKSIAQDMMMEVVDSGKEWSEDAISKRENEVVEMLRKSIPQ